MKSVIRSIKNEINNYDDGERLVRELTSNESNAPPQELLIKLKIMLTDQYMFGSAIRMLFKRLRDYNNIRHVEKALICIEYLLKNGDRKFVRYCQMDANAIAKLQRYRYILNMQDYGGNIRKRAKRITQLLKHDAQLREQRAKAQGYSMPHKNKQKQRTNKTSSSSHQSSSNNTAKKKKKTKKKRTKKVENNEPAQPQFASLIDLPPDNNANNNDGTNGADDDLLSGDWWNTGGDQDNFDPFNVENGNNNGGDDPMSGFGDDGGQFGFGDANDFEQENKDNADDKNGNDADSWMTSLTTMDNVLEGNVNKKDANKVNKKGKSMASMAKSTSASMSTMPTNDPFANATATNDTFDPFGQNQAQQPATGLSALYQQSNNAAPPANNAFGAQNFGYQGKTNAMPYANDPFVGIGGSKNQKVVQPATYVPRQKQNDPFAQFGSM